MLNLSQTEYVKRIDELNSVSKLSSEKKISTEIRLNSRHRNGNFSASVNSLHTVLGYLGINMPWQTIYFETQPLQAFKRFSRDAF